MPFQVLTAEFAHETNTFSTRLADYEAFTKCYAYMGDQAIRERGDANTELAGFLDAGRKHGWEVHHVISAAAEPSGFVTRDAFERLTDPIVQKAKALDGSLDGILLAMHGAMVTDFCEDGEGELLARLRSVVGTEVPIAVTLDLHANVSQKMCDLAEIIISYKTYPHVDMREIGLQSGDILHRTMTAEISPRTLRVAVPMLEEANTGRTDVGPMTERLAEAVAYEMRSDVFAVSINAGFGNSDIAEVGPSVLVTFSGDPTPHQAFAQSLADDIWARRTDVINHFYPVDEAAAICRSHELDLSRGPIVVADYADNPGGGGYGDATELLRALLAVGVESACFGPIADPETVKQLQGVEIGTRVPLRLGGKVDPRYGGGPLDVIGVLISLSDGQYVGDGPMIGGLSGSFGSSAVVQLGGVTVLVTSEATQILDLQQFRAFGIDPEAMRIVALKSKHHFRAAYEDMADKIIVCDSGALCTPDFTQFEYKNVPRPIYPLDA